MRLYTLVCKRNQLLGYNYCVHHGLQYLRLVGRHQFITARALHGHIMELHVRLDSAYN